MGKLTAIGFDADDTLWQNETFFRITQDRFAALLSDYSDPDPVHARLLEAERRNLGQYGFGIKGFMLSMIETAIEVTERRVPASVIAEILAVGQEMLSHPIELLPGAEDTVRQMAESHRLILITKGDLLDQERKLAQSGLGELFDAVEIVSDKRPPVYTHAFNAHGHGPNRAMMVGNSMKSDILPALDAGAWGVFVPHDLTWAIENADAPEGHPRYRELRELTDVVEIVRQIES